MELREFDVCVYGATGFTGQRICKYLFEEHPEISVLVCGRNGDKLNALMKAYAADSKLNARVCVAAADQSEALCAAFGQCRVVLNAAGPYRYTGLNIIQAAISSGTHYLDLCGEPEFFDRALLAFDHSARNAGLLVVSACAFDCVPAELGASLAMDPANSGNGGQCTSIRVLHHVVPGEHGGKGFVTTWHAAMDGLAASLRGELRSIREAVVAAGYHEPPREKPKLSKPSQFPQWDPQVGMYCALFPGADSACIRSSQRYLSKYQNGSSNVMTKWPSIRVEFCVESGISAMKVVLVGLMIQTLIRWKFGVGLLKKYPAIFSLGAFSESGPSEVQLDETRFETKAYAFSGDTQQSADLSAAHEAIIRGPEPGYRATSRISTALIRLVLKYASGASESESLPCGVSLPGAAFFANPKTRKEAVALLIEEGIEIHVVKKMRSPV